MLAGLQQIGLECACCRQMYNPTAALHDSVEAAIFGAERYAVCSVCGRVVPAELRDRDYERRWRRATRLNFSRGDCKLLIALSLLANRAPSAESDKLFNLVLRRAQIRFPDKTWPELKQTGDEIVRFVRKR